MAQKMTMVTRTEGSALCVAFQGKSRIKGAEKRRNSIKTHTVEGRATGNPAMLSLHWQQALEQGDENKDIVSKRIIFSSHFTNRYSYYKLI